MSTSVSTNQSQLLSAMESSNVLDHALSLRVPVQLSASGAPNAVVWRGAFQESIQEDLMLASVDQRVELPADWWNAILRATFCSANLAYAFETRLIQPTQDRAGRVIGIAKPRRLELIERRRAARRRFRSATRVRLFHNEDGRPPIECALLNLSALGLACRVEPTLAGSIPLGSIVRTQFALEPERPCFEFDARLVTATPNGTGDAVWGIEFIENKDYARQRNQLLKALSYPESSARSSRSPIC